MSHRPQTASDGSEEHVTLDYHLRKSSLPYHQEISRLAIAYSSDGDEMLDIGTGAGSVPFLVSQTARRTIDVADAYQSCLTAAGERLPVRKAYLIDEQTFDVTDQIPAEMYPVITMSHVLEHLLNPAQGVRDAMHLLKPGGHLILAVPNPVRPLVMLSALLRRRYSNRGHVVAWDRSHWMNFLEHIMGLEVVEYGRDYVQLLPKHWPSVLRRLEIALVRIAPWWSFSNIAVVRKPSQP